MRHVNSYIVQWLSLHHVSVDSTSRDISSVLNLRDCRVVPVPAGASGAGRPLCSVDPCEADESRPLLACLLLFGIVHSEEKRCFYIVADFVTAVVLPSSLF